MREGDYLAHGTYWYDHTSFEKCDNNVWER